MTWLTLVRLLYEGGALLLKTGALCCESLIYTMNDADDIVHFFTKTTAACDR